MRIDLGLILGHLLECVIFIYFANTSLYPKDSYLKNTKVALCGYIVLFSVGVLGYSLLSITAFFVINFLIIYRYYNSSLKGAIFISLILDTFSVLGEYMFFPILEISHKFSLVEITPQQSVILTVGSKHIYFLGILVIKKFIKKDSDMLRESMMVLSIIPITTVICSTVLLNANINDSLFWIICILLILVNIVVFSVDEIVNIKNTELRNIQQKQIKNEAELVEYKQISEKYDSLRYLQHDFKKHLDILKIYIDTEKTKAMEYIDQIQLEIQETAYNKYTDNNILNIIINRKADECRKNNINIKVNSNCPQLNFVTEFDSVAIFSNLLDNAIEACKNSKEKNLFMDLYTVNDAFSVVKIENSSDLRPIVLHGNIRTAKTDSDNHGIGIKSINYSLKKYGSSLDWSYDNENKIFRTIVHMRIPNEDKLTI